MRFENYNFDGDYKALIVSYGTMSRVCRTAIDRLKADGLRGCHAAAPVSFPISAQGYSMKPLKKKAARPCSVLK